MFLQCLGQNNVNCRRSRATCLSPLSPAVVVAVVVVPLDYFGCGFAHLVARAPNLHDLIDLLASLDQACGNCYRRYLFGNPAGAI